MTSQVIFFPVFSTRYNFCGWVRLKLFIESLESFYLYQTGFNLIRRSSEGLNEDNFSRELLSELGFFFVK